MHRSNILLGIVALMPAALLVTSHSSLGAASGDGCRLKPDGSAPTGLHWYYRVDRTNNRHCWYLHAQGMQVHSLGIATSHREVENDAADEEAPKTPLVVETPRQRYEELNSDFTSRWVDLPKSVDLNAPGLIAASNGYAPEQGTAASEEDLPSALASVSVMNGQVQQTSAGADFGSISLAGAAILALLLISEALVRLVRRSGWTVPHRKAPPLADPDRNDFQFATERSRQRVNSWTARPVESRAQTGTDELRGLLQRAGRGLKPPQSFAPSRSMHHHDHSGRDPAHSVLSG